MSQVQPKSKPLRENHQRPQSVSHEEGRTTVFTEAKLSVLVPQKQSHKRGVEAILKENQSLSRVISGSSSTRSLRQTNEIFQEGGRRKFQSSKSIDLSKCSTEDLRIPRKAHGIYNQEAIRDKMEKSASTASIQRNNQSQSRDRLDVSQDRKIVPQKIKTYYDQPEILKYSINKDFQVALPKTTTSHHTNTERPIYYLSSKNVQRAFNNSEIKTRKQACEKLNQSITLMNDLAHSKQYIKDVQSNTIKQNTEPLKPSSSFNRVPILHYRQIHTNRVAVSSNGASFYLN